jgi:hypothetical protein
MIAVIRRSAGACQTHGMTRLLRAFIVAVPTMVVVVPAFAQPPTAGSAAAPASWSLLAQETFRVESWRFFEPPPGGGDPDYTFGGNRLLLQARYTAPRLDVRLAAQHVVLAGLPRAASGPGAFGTGALYFDQAGRRRHPQQLYLRYASVRVKNALPGLSFEVGRQAYASGAEAASEPALEAVKRQRLDARLVGEFEWSIYQRSFDGVRADLARGNTRVTGVAFLPTTGGFAREAGRTITDLIITGATVDLLPSRARPHTQVQAFVWRYDDDRAVTGRPDNTGRTAPRADVRVTTVGGSVVGVYPVRGGSVDVLGWVAGQRGRWYGDDHGALSVAGEAGYQWTGLRTSPWVRGGFLHAGGDDDPGDGAHETFFPMLPTMRRFSQTTAYSTMNLRDLFVQVMARPAAGVNVRVDLHRLWLASAGDRWYGGSGATLSTGGNFGYVGRPSTGSTDFGTSIEASASWAITSRWAVNGFAGVINAGPVVTGTFDGDHLRFLYAETTLRLGR